MSADWWAALVLSVVSLTFGIASLCRSYYTRGLMDGRAEVIDIALRHREDMEASDE